VGQIKRYPSHSYCQQLNASITSGQSNLPRPRIVQSFAAGKTLRLNGFNIKRFTHTDCLRVLFVEMRFHWLKRDAEAFSLSRAAVIA